MEQNKVIISKSNNITCIAGSTWCGKTTHLLAELKNKITVDGKVQPFILISPELNEKPMESFISLPEHKMNGIYINSAKTEQSMFDIFDDCITTMRSTGIKVMAFDNLPKHNAMDIVRLYNKLKIVEDLTFIFSHNIAVDDKVEHLDERYFTLAMPDYF